MKQTLYEKIKTIVESWHIAITQDEKWNNRLWSSMWEWWIVRASTSFESLNYCYYSLWFHYYHRFEIEEIEKKWERYIWIYERPLWRPKYWDYVTIMSGRSHQKHKDIEWKKLAVTGTSYEYCEVMDLNQKTRIWLIVPYDCIAPWVEIDE